MSILYVCTYCDNFHQILVNLCCTNLLTICETTTCKTGQQYYFNYEKRIINYVKFCACSRVFSMKPSFSL